MRPGHFFAIAFAALTLTNCDSGQNESTQNDIQGTAKGIQPISRAVINVIDVNPDPAIFEASLSVDEQDATIDGTVVKTLIYKDLNNPDAYPAVTDGIPVPQIIVNVGDEIIVDLTNNLDVPCAAKACDTSIHWHGLELDNDSDGTGVTQNHVAPGENYTYRFKTFRPGIFWIHPHMKPGPQTFAGVYGVFIVKDPDEESLQADLKIPSIENTQTLVLSDIEYDIDGDVGYLNGGDAIPWATQFETCAGSGATCTGMADAATVLVNGQSTSTVPTISAKSGAGVRLRLLSLSTNRYFRLRVAGNGLDNNLYRIGGEGGFLDLVRLEGGMMGSLDSKYNSGEVLVPASGRSDVVIVPTGNDGDVISIFGDEYERGGPPNTGLAAGELLRIEIDNSLEDDAFSITAGNDVLGAGGVEDIKTEPLDFYQDPIPALAGPGSGLGSSNEVISMDGIMAGVLGIDGIQGHFEDSGDDYTQVPYQETTRYALTGDLLEITITQSTNQHHPFHHHGFSFQPVRILDTEDPPNLLYEYDYNEFVDVIDVPNGTQIVFRIRLDDRPRITDNRQEGSAPAPGIFHPSGGAAGRWVMHCHLFLHAGLGMITELVVLDTDRDGDGFDTSVDCNDTDPAINPDAPEVCDDGIDNNCDGFIDDCNQPPIAEAGDDQILECSSPTGTLAILDGTASSDPDLDPLTYLWSAPDVTFDDQTSATPTGTFPQGETIVTLTVSDGEFEDSDTLLVTVEDTTPPVIDLFLDPDSLWPPNHKMVEINATVNVTDSCDANPDWWLSLVNSSEPDNGQGDGNTVNDIQNVIINSMDTQFDLRAERQGGGSGRIYSIEYQAEDADGNTAIANGSVVVPHNR